MYFLQYGYIVDMKLIDLNPKLEISYRISDKHCLWCMHVWKTEFHFHIRHTFSNIYPLIYWCTSNRDINISVQFPLLFLEGQNLNFHNFFEVDLDLLDSQMPDDFTHMGLHNATLMPRLASA